MKKKRHILLATGMWLSTLMAIGAPQDLPKVEILGKEYYYHEIKKGESLYGIAKQHGWDLEELVRLNPSAASEMSKGSRLYYPTGRVTVVKDLNVAEAVTEEKSPNIEPIHHVVKRGETVYGIARQYNIPVETIYASCPNAKYGIKAGETLVIEQPNKGEGGYVYYVVKPGDTLYSLAQRYHTSVEDILLTNPGVSDRNFRIGDTVRVPINSNARRIHTELVEEERLKGIDSYKVGKKEGWDKIAEKTGVDVETLKEANENLPQPKKNDVVNVPVIETVVVEKEVVPTDPRETTSEGIRELYDSIHNTNSAERLERVKVALLLEEPKGRRDIDFTRGFLTALDGMKNTPFKIDFKVLDGREANDKILASLDEFNPNLVIVTADKQFPTYLAEYGNTNHVEVVNVFDIKSDLCEDNSSIIQLLPSSAYFNQQMGDQLAGDYGEKNIVMVGNKDSGDGIAEAFLTKLGEKKISKTSVSNLTNYDITGDKEYLFYCYSTRKDEIADIMQAVDNIREREPLADITVVGRPNWVTYIETLGDRFGENGVIIPSRVWFDNESSEAKRFLRQYSSLFGEAPTKSFPNFAVSGYDIANYFIPATAENGGDFNKNTSLSAQKMLQSDIRLERMSNWGGFVNKVGYLVKFRPGGFVDKIMLR